LLGVRSGAEVALELAAARPELVRRLILVDVPPAGRSPPKQPALVLNAADELFEADAKALAAQIAGFLTGRA
jgi:pimeloyl-ACP methyl ester carboxylesterase